MELLYSISILVLWILDCSTACPEHCRCPVPSQVDCSDSGLTSMPTHLMSGVRILDLSRNQITEIHQDAFIKLKATNISVIILDQNEIQNIAPYAFRGLHNLEILSLRRNRITRLEENAFSGLTGREDVCMFNRACYVDFTENDIGLIEPNALAWIKSMSIYLGKSRVNLKLKAYAFYGIRDTPSIQIVDVPKIDIEPRAFTNAENVESLEITNIMIPWIKPYSFEGLTNLITINISECEIGLIEKYAFSGIHYQPDFESNLTSGGSGGHFILQSCSIQTLPTHAFLDTNIAMITIKKNSIISIGKHAFQGLPGIQRLHIIGNTLNNLHSYSLASLKNMKEIILHRNEISVIESGAFYRTQEIDYISVGLNPNINLTLKHHAFKQMFDISHFAIEQMNHLNVEPRAFEDMFGIDMLEIKNVYLPTLHTGAFKGLSKVKILRLSNCDLSHVQPQAFGTATSAGTIDVLDLTEGNSLPCNCDTSLMLQEFESTFSMYKVSCIDSDLILEGQFARDMMACSGWSSSCNICTLIVLLVVASYLL